MENLNYSTTQQPGSSEGNTLIIDGDSIAWMIGWHHREHREVELMHGALDTWMREFLTLSSAKSYLGILGPSYSGQCFRYHIYKFKPYKGNRAGKEETNEMEWIRFWEPVVREHLMTKWKFLQAPAHLETDDVVAMVAMGLMYEEATIPVICSPDKDLRQIPGLHLNYKPARKKAEEEGQGLTSADLVIQKVTSTEAKYNWCMQMLMGDSADNIAGIPGMGEKKAAELLKSVDEIMWGTTVKRAYEKHFGPYYGPIIYAETEATVTMMTPEHPLWEKYGIADLSVYRNGFQDTEELKECTNLLEY